MRTLIERELGNAEIVDIQLGEKDGKNIYKVDAEFADGREFELDLAEDGTIVKKKF